MNFEPTQLPLDGVRILDLSRVVSGPFATQVLADLGAQVIRVESLDLAGTAPAAPTSLSESEAFSWGLNRNKWSVCVDLKSSQGRDVIHRLAAESDIVFDNFRPGVMERLGLGREALVASAGEHLITCSLTGFGATGPWAQMPAYDPIVQAMSGAMHITRFDEDGGRPVRWGIPIGDILTGLYSAIGMLAALTERDHSGWGQHVDVAMLDVMLALNTVRVPMALSFGWEPVAMPYEGGQGTVPYGTFRCRDGWIAIGVMERSWSAACTIIGRPDLVEDPRFADRAARQLNRRELVAEFQSAMAELQVDVVQREFLEAGIIAGKVNGIREVFDHPQVRARDMSVEIADDLGRAATVAGDPLKMSDTATWRAPRRPGSDTDMVLRDLLGMSGAEIDALHEVGAVAGRGHVMGDSGLPSLERTRPPLATNGPRRAPLDGSLVVEMDGEEPSKAFAAQILADLGARVIRVDRPPTQHDDPYPDEARASAYRCGLNRNKQSVTADLKSADGRAFVSRLLRRADGVLDNYRPGVSARLGVDYASLRELNPTVVSCSITGFGHTGPWSGYPAFDAAIQALGGGQSISADAGTPDLPVRWGNPIGGLTGSLYAAIGMIAGLRGRHVHGTGRRVDLALLDAQVALLSYRVPQALTVGKEFRPDPRRGGSGSLPFGVFDAADGTWFVLGITQQFWRRFCDVIEMPELADDPRFADEPLRRTHQVELDAVVEAAMLRRDAMTWQDMFFAARLPGVAVLSIDAAFASEQVEARRMRVALPDARHPEGVVVAGQPIKMSAVEPTFNAAPVTGADTEAVAKELASIAADSATLDACDLAETPALH